MTLLIDRFVKYSEGLSFALIVNEYNRKTNVTCDLLTIRFCHMWPFNHAWSPNHVDLFHMWPLILLILVQ